MTSYSDEVLRAVQKYLGPSAITFLDRQAKSHMNGLDFGSIDREHSTDLTKWIETSAGLLIGKEKAAEMAGAFRKI